MVGPMNAHLFSHASQMKYYTSRDYYIVARDKVLSFSGIALLKLILTWNEHVHTQFHLKTISLQYEQSFTRKNKNATKNFTVLYIPKCRGCPLPL